MTHHKHCPTPKEFAGAWTSAMCRVGREAHALLAYMLCPSDFDQDADTTSDVKQNSPPDVSEREGE